MSAGKQAEVSGRTVGERMLHLLSDGLPHAREEMHACLWDELGSLSNIKAHVSSLRKILKPRGMHVMIEQVNHRLCYRLVALISAADLGRLSDAVPPPSLPKP